MHNDSALVKIFFNSSLSGYLLMAIKMITGFVITKVLFSEISNEDYGFWVLLWSFYGYSVLFDFGQGVAAQKKSAEYLCTGETEGYSNFISTMLINYLFISVLIMLATLGIASNIGSFTQGLTPEKIHYFKMVTYCFGFGTAIYFPLGFFNEVLAGLHCVTQRNCIQLISRIIYFSGIIYLSRTGLDLISLSIWTILTQIIECSYTAFFCRTKIPNVFKILKLKYCSKTLKENIPFSLCAYIITFSGLIIYRTDVLVITFLASTSAIAFYHIASRFSELLSQFSKQFLAIIGPIIASLSKNQESDKVRSFTYMTIRVSGVICLLPALLLFLFMENLFEIWLNFNNTESFLICGILLLSTFLFCYFRAPLERSLMMNNDDHFLAKLTSIEALTNLILSITLYQFYGILGVALGTLIPNLLIIIFYALPKLIELSTLNFKNFSIQIFIVPLIMGLCTYSVGEYSKLYFQFDNLMNIFCSSLFLSTLYSILVYFLVLNEKEKNYIKEKLKVLTTGVQYAYKK